MDKFKELTKKWIKEKSQGPKADWSLAALSFSEAIFFPIPPDLLLIPITLSLRNKWIKLALLTTLSSVLGALVGYLLGAFVFEIAVEPIVQFYSLQGEMLLVAEWFSKGTFIVMFASALTPIPFKVFTLTAGILGAPVLPFLIASILGRGLRFFIEGFLLYKFGGRISRAIYKMINWYSLIILVILIALIALYFYVF